LPFREGPRRHGAEVTADTFHDVVDDAGDQVIEGVDQGRDEVRTTLSGYKLADNVENLRALGTAGLVLFGNGLNNSVMGAAGADTLHGGDGNDSLSGGDGDDRLLGGAGDDILMGGNGFDVASYADAAGGVKVTLAVTSRQQTGGAGQDTLSSIEGLEGSNFNDILTGSAGANHIWGGAGKDVIDGADGDDTLFAASDGDTLSGGAGFDTVVYSRVRSDYVIVQEGSQVRVHLVGDPTASDLLTDVERISFADGIVDLIGNSRPSASDDVATAVAGGRPVSGSLLANDGDPDADILTILETGSHVLQYGTLTIAADGSFTYQVSADSGLAAGASAVESFTYTASDGRGGTDQASISISVSGPALPPPPAPSAPLPSPAPSPAPSPSPAPAPPAPVASTGNLIFVQREGGFGSVAFTGDAARVTKNGAVVVDWTVGSKIGGIPQGDGYVLEVKTGATTTSSPLAVGVVVVTMGQSNMNGWLTSQTSLTPDDVFVWKPSATGGSWVPATGAGMLVFAETLRSELGDVPVAVVNGAMNGTRLVSDGKSSAWADRGPGTLYQKTLDQLNAATGGRAELVIWNQGEADAGSGVSEAAYSAALRQLMSDAEAAMGDPAFLVSGLAALQSGGSVIREGQASAARSDDDATYIATPLDVELIDTTHLTNVSQAWQAVDVAYAALRAMGRVKADAPLTSGTSAGDTIIGTGGADRVAGMSGDDVIRLGAGNDIGRGQSGRDVLHGGDGNDLLSGGTEDDRLFGEAGNDDLFGDGGDDVLIGGIGDDLLNGGAGADAMAGGAGDDRYFVDSIGDTVTEDMSLDEGGGTDTVTSSVTFTLSANVENLVLSGAANINGTGNDGNNVIGGNALNNRLSGEGGDDRLSGNAGDDVLLGGAGADRLDGGAGSDVMAGGAGDDSYVVDNVNDTVREQDEFGRDEGGVDSVLSTVSFALPDFVENLNLSGSGNSAGTGNSLD
jgi:VCBS repeat-containing protein